MVGVMLIGLGILVFTVISTFFYVNIKYTMGINYLGIEKEILMNIKDRKRCNEIILGALCKRAGLAFWRIANHAGVFMPAGDHKEEGLAIFKKISQEFLGADAKMIIIQKDCVSLQLETTLLRPSEIDRQKEKESIRIVNEAFEELKKLQNISNDAGLTCLFNLEIKIKYI